MNPQIIISRLSNFLFFVQKTNRHNLIKFDLRKYLSDENFNLSFYGKSESEIWKQIEKLTGKQDVKRIKKDILPLKPVFSSHWNKASKNLLLWERNFQNNRLLLQQTIFELQKLCGIKYSAIAPISIYLISDPVSKDKEISAWFSWTPKESFIVIGIPLGLKTPNNVFPISVLAHEFFHLMLRGNKNLLSAIIKITKENEKLFAKLSGDMPNRIFLEELLISSFIPEGYLSEKYLDTKVIPYTSKPKDLLTWRKFTAFKLYQTAKKYINNAQQIDRKYLRDLIGVIKQNAK